MCLWLFLYLKLVDNIEEFLTKDHTMNMLVFKYDIVKQQSRVFEKFFFVYLTLHCQTTVKGFTQKVRLSMYF